MLNRLDAGSGGITVINDCITANTDRIVAASGGSATGHDYTALITANTSELNQSANAIMSQLQIQTERNAEANAAAILDAVTALNASNVQAILSAVTALNASNVQAVSGAADRIIAAMAPNAGSQRFYFTHSRRIGGYMQLDLAEVYAQMRDGSNGGATVGEVLSAFTHEGKLTHDLQMVFTAHCTAYKTAAGEDYSRVADLSFNRGNGDLQDYHYVVSGRKGSTFSPDLTAYIIALRGQVDLSYDYTFVNANMSLVIR